ncbi:MAG TPA: response regulator, partial [Thermoanaerobaculia bacterium]|nr:response regulator [Thermoanaerobaculia bacterium]
MTHAPPDGAPLRVLILEDVPTDAELEVRELRRSGIAVEWTRVETEAAFREALASFDPGIVLADYSLPGWNGIAALTLVRAERPDLPFIVVTGALDEETAADCIKRGADDYVLKERLSRLPHAVRSARDAWATRVARREAEEELRLRNSALEAAADGVLLTDLEGRIAWANPSFTQITGWPLEEIRGRNPNLLKSGLQRDAFYRQMWETIVAGGVWRGELYNPPTEGAIHPQERTIPPPPHHARPLT